MYYLWYYEDDDTLKRSHHRTQYDSYCNGGRRGQGWASRQAAHAYKTRNGLNNYIVMKATEPKQVDLEDYIKKKGP